MCRFAKTRVARANPQRRTDNGSRAIAFLCGWAVMFLLTAHPDDGEHGKPGGSAHCFAWAVVQREGSVKRAHVILSAK